MHRGLGDAGTGILATVTCMRLYFSSFSRSSKSSNSNSDSTTRIPATTSTSY